MKHQISLNPRFVLVRELKVGDVTLEARLPVTVDYDVVSPATVKALETSVHVLVDGQTFEQRRGLPPVPGQTDAAPTHTMMPAMGSVASVVKGEPPTPGRVY